MIWWITKHSHEEWRLAEVLMAFASILYGGWLLLPCATFDVGAIYTMIVALRVPEWSWGIVFFATGLLRLYSSLRRRHFLRQAMALIGFWKWTLFWLLLFLGNPTAGFPVLCLVFAFCSLCSYLSAINCDVVNGECNGIYVRRIVKLAKHVERVSERTRIEDGHD